MRLAIVGGALQGMEAVYLSKRAGYETILIDRKKHAPALSLADEACVMDPIKDPDLAMRIFSDCDAVIPACEELDLLKLLDSKLKGTGIPLLFDMRSYEISCSKERSNILMDKAGVPLPRPWPECGFPVIVKPSCQSGSVGVTAARNEEERQAGLKKVSELNDVPIVQEFVSGRSISIEAIGDGEKARAYVTTEVVLDRKYDCKMVRCNPNIISHEEDEMFRDVCRKTAELMHLKALMDMEAIDTPRGLRVLEIDARIPSQTPAAIDAGSGINLLKELVDCAMGRAPSGKDARRAGVYEHYVFRNGILSTSGEKEFGHIRNPRICAGLFGSDRMITDYEPGKAEWHATVITEGRDEADADRKRMAVRERMICESEAKVFDDGSPELI
ncbi:MAG: 3-methylornithine--L-lysine ligase PylC [Candidatus Methanomethylophilaceae archaeon]|nr:3-methylornithine--L-lysine ligase [Candidatus Methanomethylophilaceae archaeon]